MDEDVTGRAALEHFLTTTRAVRKRLDPSRPVDRMDIRDCLRLAIQAPSGGNRQIWRWLVITDPGLRASVGDLYRQAVNPYNDFLEASSSDAGQLKLASSSRHLERIIDQIPVFVVPCALGTPADRKERLAAAGYPVEVLDNLAAAGFYGSVWPAVWSFMLALRSRGLGSVLTTLHLVKAREMVELLGIPEDVTQLGLIPIAHYSGVGFKPAARMPLESVTFLERWGEEWSES